MSTNRQPDIGRIAQLIDAARRSDAARRRESADAVPSPAADAGAAAAGAKGIAETQPTAALAGASAHAAPPAAAPPAHKVAEAPKGSAAQPVPPAAARSTTGAGLAPSARPSPKAEPAIDARPAADAPRASEAEAPAAAPAAAPPQGASPPPQQRAAASGHASQVRRAGWLIIVGALVPIFAWMAFAPLSMAVVSPAFVKVDLNRRPVQHREGGIVRTVFVRDGQAVSAGDPILELGDVAVAADRSRLSLRVSIERATVARLEAETQLSPTLAFADELRVAAEEDPRIDEALGKELALFKSRREALDSESRLLLQQRTHIEAEIASVQAEVHQAEASLAAQQRDLDRSHELVKEGFVSVTRVNELEGEVADYASRLEQRRSEVARAQQRLVDTNLKLVSARNAYIQFASDQLKMALARQGELEQELRKSEDAAERQLVTAPADGVIIDLKFTSPGAVVQAGESIADVVPSDAPLLIEAQVRPEDITHVIQGQQARIKVLAYRYSGTITGVVDYVSADRLIDPAGYPYYTAMIAADKASLEEAGDVKLQAGMPVEVYIQGKSQTALQYMIEPITATLRKAATPL